MVVHQNVSRVFLREPFSIFPCVFAALPVPTLAVIFPVILQFGVTIFCNILLIAGLTFVHMTIWHTGVFVEISEGFLNPALETHLTALHGAS